MKKVIDFIKRGKFYYIVSLIVLCIMSIMYAVFGIFPFGNGTVCYYDDYSQFGPFMSMIRDNLYRWDNVFFTFLNGGTETMPQAMMYCIFSPFNLLYIALPMINVYYVYNIVQVLKMIAMAVVLLWFINKRFPSIRLEYKIAISVMYAFASYTIIQHSYTAWLDFMIYMPLLWHNFINMLDDRKVFPFAIVIALMIINCYVLGVFSLIILSFVMLLYIFMVQPKEKQGKNILDLIASYIIAIVLNLGVIYIAFKGVLGSSRVDAEGTPFLERINSNNTTDRLTFLLFDFITIIGVVIYLKNCNRSLRINKFLVSINIFNLLFNCCDSLYLIANGFSYNGFAYRLGFITVFFLFLTFAYYLKDESEKEALVPDIKKSKWQYLLLPIVAVIGIVDVVVSYVYCYVEMGVELSKSISTNYILITMLLLVMVLAVVLYILKQLHKMKIISKLCFKLGVLILVLSNIANSSMLCMFAGGPAYNTNVIETITEFKEMYNIDKTERLASANCQQNLVTNLTNNSQFNSLIKIPEYVNMLDVVSNAVYVIGNSNVFTNSLLGYKYIVSYDEIKADYLELKHSNDGVYIYENTLALEKGIVLDNYTLDIPADTDPNIAINMIYQYLGGEGDIFKKFNLADILEGRVPEFVVNTETIIENEYFTSSDYILNIDFLPNSDSVLYANYAGILNSVTYYANGTPVSLSDIFYVSNTNKIEMELLQLHFQYIYLEMVEISLIDYNKLYDLFTNLEKRKVDVSYDNETMVIKTVATSDTESLIYTMAKQDKFVATVNGERVDIDTTIGDLMCFDLKAGENEIVITYVDDTNLKFIILFVSGILLGIIVYILYKRLGKIIDKSSNFFRILTIVYVIAIIAMVDVCIILEMLASVMVMVTTLLILGGVSFVFFIK